MRTVTMMALVLARASWADCDTEQRTVSATLAALERAGHDGGRSFGAYQRAEFGLLRCRGHAKETDDVIRNWCRDKVMVMVQLAEQIPDQISGNPAGASYWHRELTREAQGYDACLREAQASTDEAERRRAIDAAQAKVAQEEAAADQERMNEAKSERRPLAYAGAICGYLERARHARGSQVTYKNAPGIYTTYNTTKADAVRWLTTAAKRLKKRAAAEHVKIIECGDRRVHQIALCAIDASDDCSDASDAAADARDLMNETASDGR